jgi:SAM-dependent methyltransferase
MNRTRTNLIRLLFAKGVAPSQITTQLQVRSALRECKSVLDIGCGPNSSLSLLGFDRLVGIDGYAPNVENARRNQTHHEVVQGDARDLTKYFRPGEFDACVAQDVIEHLTKEDGLRLIAAMERIAARKVVFLTPNGFLPQRHTEDADLEEHLSGWAPAEMRRLGYHVSGVLGPKGLRGEYHKLTWKPAAVWGLVSLVGHFAVTHWVPSWAEAILCVKTK